MNNRNIILTGFMGTGKTTVGRHLSEKLMYEFVDTDELIMSRFDMTIADIFETKGENAFRAMERAIALELAEKDRLVISTGGRMMLDEANKKALGKKGRIFCLVAGPDEIISRIVRDEGIERPLLKTSNPRNRIMELMKEREEGYARFFRVDTTGKTPEEVSDEVISVFQVNGDVGVPG